IGQGFVGAEPEDQSTMACGIRIGHSAPRNAQGTRRAVDFLDAKADAEAALASIGAPVGNLMVMRNAPDWFHPGRSAVLSLGPKNPLAVFGELHPKVLKEMGVKGAAIGFTIFPDNVPFKKAKTKARPALHLNDLQAVERDFAFLVNSDVEVEKLIKSAKSADKKLISDVTVFDIFEGKNTDGKKSVAISVRLQPIQATLTDKEIEAISDRIIAAVTKATGGELRV
ncbi:MAG: phenylalanine--tRNA ligase subunit beta, partial [Rhodobacteraceae bacterium]|nr:phenylalanine--tRNA ligase subunit beta [Paracoccaceae bacterium]